MHKKQKTLDNTRHTEPHVNWYNSRITRMGQTVSEFKTNFGPETLLKTFLGQKGGTWWDPHPSP